jgi:hypothetical protein
MKGDLVIWEIAAEIIARHGSRGESEAAPLANRMLEDRAGTGCQARRVRRSQPPSWRAVVTHVPNQNGAESVSRPRYHER